MFGILLSRINCVKGEGSSSYLSKGKFSITIQQYFSYIVTVNFIDGGNGRKPLTCRKSLVNINLQYHKTITS
jgi:hypothetical protein